MLGLKKTIIFLFIMGLVYQCKKKDTPEPSIEPAVTTTSTGSNPVTYTANGVPISLPIASSLIDTIFPNSYFPAFPNSFWRYLDTNGDTSSSYTSNTYILDYYMKPYPPLVISASAYVPLYNGIPIWGYFEHQTNSLYNASLNMPRILSDSLPVGTSWDDTFGAGSIGSRSIKCLDTTIIINGISYDSTIVIEYSRRQASNPMSKAPFLRRYFTKNIGIIREETLVIDWGTPPTFIISYVPSVTKNLQSYFINH